MAGMTIQLSRQSMVELSELVATAVITALEEKKLIGGTVGTVVNNATVVEKPKKKEKSAYAKTEALLYNYNGFKRIVEERIQEIEEIRIHGVPQRCGGVTDYVQKGGLPHGIVLPEESVEAAIRTVQASVEDTVQALAMIDKCMAAMQYDPYYKLLEMLYFEGRTQEDIASYFGVSQVTISNNKGRLVRELSMRLFPNQAINEMMK